MARRIRATAEPSSTDPQEIFAKNMEIIGPLKLDSEEKHDSYRKAHSAYRAALKQAKNQGVDIEALTDALKTQREASEQPERVEARFRNFNNYLKWLDVPIGTQFGVFGDTTPPRAKDGKAAANDRKRGKRAAVNEQLGAAAKARAYNDGHRAGASGKGATANDCPYREANEAALAAEWKRGLMDAQSETAESMAPPQKVKEHNAGVALQ